MTIKFSNDVFLYNLIKLSSFFHWQIWKLWTLVIFLEPLPHLWLHQWRSLSYSYLVYFVCDFEFQETAICFIDRLMDEYPAYNDIIQPIQVAVYEMKFGLSLVLSSTLEKEYLRKVGHENINLVMVYFFKDFFHI